MYFNIVSFFGFFGFLLVAWLFSSHRRVINLSLLLWGVLLQFVFGAVVFLLPAGRRFFSFLNDGVFSLLSHANEGISFVFGRLALPPGQKDSLGVFLAFQVLPAAVFFAAIVAFLYHIGFMPMLIRFFSRLFTGLMRVSGAESLCVSSNIFVGVESSLTIRPYLSTMTRSELCTILTAGMATIASTVLALYASFLQQSFPQIAGHLISASIVSAPAALLISKLLLPETETPQTLGQEVKSEGSHYENSIESLIKGSMEGAKLAVGIGATLITFVSLVALANSFVGWTGQSLGAPHQSLQSLASYAFYPLVLLMGVPTQDAWSVAHLLATRTFLTEFPCYLELSKMLQQGTLHDPRSAVIAVYALCGFAHIPSLGIFVGGMAAIAPERARDLSAVAFRALFAATLACMMTGALAGVFYHGQDTLLIGKPASKTAPQLPATSVHTNSSTRRIAPQHPAASKIPDMRAKTTHPSTQPPVRSLTQPDIRPSALPHKPAATQPDLRPSTQPHKPAAAQPTNKAFPPASRPAVWRP
ncbi:nucleoside transporter [Myxococcota bacterium]|nr:nucleoside transporter [Myxococcota bacterium]